MGKMFDGIYATDGEITLRPMTAEDESAYRDIKMNHSKAYAVIEHFEPENNRKGYKRFIIGEIARMCAIVADDKVIGYVGINNITRPEWEIAIELRKDYMGRGIGPRAVKLLVNEIFAVTGRDTFRVRIMPDNIPSQKCFEKIGATFCGLQHSPFLSDEKSRENFIKRNPKYLTDEHISALAERFGVTPEKMMTSVIEYKLRAPIGGEK